GREVMRRGRARDVRVPLRVDRDRVADRRVAEASPKGGGVDQVARRIELGDERGRVDVLGADATVDAAGQVCIAGRVAGNVDRGVVARAAEVRRVEDRTARGNLRDEDVEVAREGPLAALDGREVGRARRTRHVTVADVVDGDGDDPAEVGACLVIR